MGSIDNEQENPIDIEDDDDSSNSNSSGSSSDSSGGSQQEDCDAAAALRRKLLRRQRYQAARHWRVVNKSSQFSQVRGCCVGVLVLVQHFFV